MNVLKNSRVLVAALVVSASTLAGVAEHEGWFGKADIPIAGDVPTVGFGFTKDVKMGDTITPVRAVIRLADELENVYAAGIRKCIKVPLYVHEWEAFLELSYNIGTTAFCRKADKRTVDDKGRPKLPESDRLIDLINAERYEDACERIKAFNKAPDATGKLRVVRGLVNRREKEYRKCMGLYALH